jgi:HAD superfamily hydrolase (TIGR01509 family)
VIRAIIFDCFGVLYVTPKSLYFAKFPDLHDQLYDLDRQSDYGFIDRRTYTQAVAKLTGVSIDDTEQAFATEYTLNHPLIEYIRRELKPAYKTGLISNLGIGWIHDFFDAHQLHDLFDTIVISGKEGIAKPDPRIYKRAAKRLNMPPDECLFIDDRQINCDGAVAAGMQSMLFTDFPTFQKQLKQLL